MSGNWDRDGAPLFALRSIQPAKKQERKKRRGAGQGEKMMRRNRV
ncbi:hypothetical protein CLOM621_05474 [Clostridium sp. M62/1]|nr:hypothetical protein CLOM621_05474 [Clostridium sp. M62/1]